MKGFKRDLKSKIIAYSRKPKDSISFELILRECVLASGSLVL
jgi:hypothetical protein